MTSTRQGFGPMRPRSRSNRDRILSAGLATTACVGLVGVIGVRTIEQSAATETASQASPTTTSGLSQADLNAYADQLKQQSLELDAYRASLVTLSNRLHAAGKQAPKPAPKPVTKPAPMPVAKPAPASKPASNTKSS